MTIDHHIPEFRANDGFWHGELRYELYQWTGTLWEWHKAPFSIGRELCRAVFNSPLCLSAVDFLGGLETLVYKITYFEAVDLPLIAKSAATSKRMYSPPTRLTRERLPRRSTGNGGTAGAVSLCCIASAPIPGGPRTVTSTQSASWRRSTMMWPASPTVSSGCGGIRRGGDGGIGDRNANRAATHRWYPRCRSQQRQEAMTVFRRSIYAVADVVAGETFTTNNVRTIRPGCGLKAKYPPKVPGRKMSGDLARNTLLNWKIVE